MAFCLHMALAGEYSYLFSVLIWLLNFLDHLFSFAIFSSINKYHKSVQNFYMILTSGSAYTKVIFNGLNVYWKVESVSGLRIIEVNNLFELSREC